jgi:hypothetical protein
MDELSTCCLLLIYADSECRGRDEGSRAGEVELYLAAIRVSIASRRFRIWSNIGVKIGVTLALTRASKSSSTGRAILEFSTGFEVGVGIDKNFWEESSFRIFVAGRKCPASSRGLEHMFLSNYQSKKTNIETQINFLEREKTRTLKRSYYYLNSRWLGGAIPIFMIAPGTNVGL